jgi:hypothetical protein
LMNNVRGVHDGLNDCDFHVVPDGLADCEVHDGLGDYSCLWWAMLFMTEMSVLTMAFMTVRCLWC